MKPLTPKPRLFSRTPKPLDGKWKHQRLGVRCLTHTSLFHTFGSSTVSAGYSADGQYWFKNRRLYHRDAPDRPLMLLRRRAPFLYAYMCIDQWGTPSHWHAFNIVSRRIGHPPSIYCFQVKRFNAAGHEDNIDGFERAMYRIIERGRRSRSSHSSRWAITLGQNMFKYWSTYCAHFNLPPPKLPESFTALMVVHRLIRGED